MSLTLIVHRRKPRLLDLCCGAGGAAVGYARAGFDVTGVDITPQSSYPFTFHQDDALTFDLSGFDAYHVSPPLQILESGNRLSSWGTRETYTAYRPDETTDCINRPSLYP